MAVKTKKPKSKTVFKCRGGSKFDLTIDNDALHDILMEECPTLAGHFKMSGVTKPQHVTDTYRAVLFFMWGIPLDTPVEPETLAKFNKIIERLKVEDAGLFKEEKSE